jgi:hypothetical protein
MLDNYEDGYLSRVERDEKLRKLDTEIAGLQPAATTAPIDAEKLARAIVRIFAGFARLPFAPPPRSAPNGRPRGDRGEERDHRPHAGRHNA